MNVNHPWWGRYMAKVEVASVDGCWKWRGARSSFGYGQIRIDGKTVHANRLMLEAKLGRKLVAGECSLHRCDVPSCVNPAHLFVGSKKDNSMDMAAKGRCVYVPRPSSVSALGKTKLTAEQVRAIRQDGRRRGLASWAAELGVSQATISNVINLKTYWWVE